MTRSPSSAWASQQLREATPWGAGPCFLIRDNDDKFGARFNEVAAGAGIEIRRYCAYFNDARPHQGIVQKIPNGPPEPPPVGGKRIEETAILGGLHHDYRLAA